MKNALRTEGGSWPLAQLAHTQVRELEANGNRYRISIGLPHGEPPEGGYPVLYVLDADASFATILETHRRLSRRPDATGVGPALIVGIGHGGDGLYDGRARHRDFTPADLPCAGDDLPPPGAEAFLGFITERVMPDIAADFAADSRRQTLLGHSLAGYFVLWTLMHGAETFANYVAISPSLWRDPTLASAIATAERPGGHVVVAAGEWDEMLAPWQKGQPDAEEIAARRASRRMVGNARAFTAGLATRFGADRVSFELFANEDHASVFAVAASRAMRIVL